MSHLSSSPNGVQLNRVSDVDWVVLKRWSSTNDNNITQLGDVKRINGSGKFDLNDTEYMESIGIMIALPGFWLILTLVFFLIFFLCRCYYVNSSKVGERSSSSSSGTKKISSTSRLGICECSLFLLTIISVTIISFGILGNFRTHTGLTKIHQATTSLASTVDILKNETSNFQNILEIKVDQDLNQISRKLNLIRNHTLLNYLQEQLLYMRRNVTTAINRSAQMNLLIEKLNLNFIPKKVDHIEFLRFTITFAILLSLESFCILLLIAICRHSRCLLILFSVLGLVSLVICWLLTSFYLGLLVTGSDFCLNPKPFVSKQFNSMVDPSIVNYYLNCDMRMSHDGDPSNNPYGKKLGDMRKSLDGFQESLLKITEICEDHCTDLGFKQILKDLKTSAKRAQETLTLLTRISGCDDIHMNFLWTMSGFCRETTEGLTLMFGSAATTGIIFTLMVLCASHIWINIRKKRPVDSDDTGPYRAEDGTEADAFLPPASGTSTTNSNESEDYQFSNFKRAFRESYLRSQETTISNRGSYHLQSSIIRRQPFSGFLLRKLKNKPRWQRLWVVYTNYCLYFYKNDTDDFPLAILPLLGYTLSLPTEDENIDKNFVFKLSSKNHVYYFRDETEVNFDRWMAVIKTAQTADPNCSVSNNLQPQHRHATATLERTRSLTSHHNNFKYLNSSSPNLNRPHSVNGYASGGHEDSLTPTPPPPDQDNHDVEL